MIGWSGSPATFTARPSSTVTCIAQVSGQSCGQAPRTTRAAMRGWYGSAEDRAVAVEVDHGEAAGEADRELEPGHRGQQVAARPRPARSPHEQARPPRAPPGPSARRRWPPRPRRSRGSRRSRRTRRGRARSARPRCRRPRARARSGWACPTARRRPRLCTRSALQRGDGRPEDRGAAHVQGDGARSGRRRAGRPGRRARCRHSPSSAGCREARRRSRRSGLARPRGPGAPRAPGRSGGGRPPQRAWRPRSARPSVISSAYSRSEPTGRPLARRVTASSGARSRRASAR